VGGFVCLIFRIFARIFLTNKVMLIEQVENSRIILNLNTKVNALDVQRLINYAMYLEATANSAAKQEEVNALADEVSRNWWKENKGSFGL
jgi:hypothetical protein